MCRLAASLPEVRALFRRQWRGWRSWRYRRLALAASLRLLLRCLLLDIRGRGRRSDWWEHAVVPVPFDGFLHALAIENEIFVANVVRPRIDHLFDSVDMQMIVGAEGDRLATVVVDVGTRSQQREDADGEAVHRHPTAFALLQRPNFPSQGKVLGTASPNS